MIHHRFYQGDGMMNRSTAFDRTILAGAVAATVCLLFNMAGMLLFRRQIFIERDSLSAVGLVMLAGFGLILLFNIVSVIWAARVTFQTRESRKSIPRLLVLGAFCLVLMPGEKVLVDEIGREMRSDLGTLGEELVLHALLMVQLCYNLLVMVTAARSLSGVADRSARIRHSE
jgi:hypothetical protein